MRYNRKNSEFKIKNIIKSLPKHYIFGSAFLACLVCLVPLVSIDAKTNTIEIDERFIEKEGIYEPNKVWTISFNKPISEESLQSIYVSKDKIGKEKVENIELRLSEDKKTVEVIPKGVGYEQGEYFLKVCENINSEDNKSQGLDKVVNMKFEIEDKALEAKATPIEVAQIQGISEEMLTSEYWINKLANKDEILLTREEIDVLNQGNIDKVHTVYNLDEYPKSLTGSEISSFINSYSMPTRTMYDGRGNVIPQGTYTEIKNNMNLGALKETNNVGYGVIVSRTDMKRYPYEIQGHNKPGDGFDRFQETALDAGEKVIVLHTSLDNKWSFVQAYNYRGWVRNSDIAIGSEEEINEFCNSEEFVIVLEEAIKLQSNNREFKYFMGTKLPIAHENEESIVVYIPTRGENGEFIKDTAIIYKNLEVSKGYLDYTRENFINQAFKLLGTQYTWGDSGDGRDCSSTVTSVYKTFGIHLPRNTDEQEIAAGSSINLSGMSHAQKYDVLEQLEPGDPIFMNGHVVMYLGKDNGEHYIIHNFSGIYENGAYRNILRTAVTPADMMTSSSKGYMDFYRSVLQLHK